MKKLRKICFIVTIVLVGSFIGVSFYIGKQIAQPSRRILQDYHSGFLADTGAHGVHLRSGELGERPIPIMCMEPSSELLPGSRGRLIREQLEERGYSLLPYGEINRTLVMLHGRNGRKEDLLTAAERFCAVGFRCLIPDMPAHGENETKTVGFGWREGEALFARRVLELSAGEFDFDVKEPYLWGMSMGGAFALKDAAQESSPWKKMILVCTFDSLDSVVNRQARMAGPLRKAIAFSGGLAAGLLDGVNPSIVRSVDLAPEITIPTLVVHGTADELITLSQGKALFDQLGAGEKDMIEVPGADHNNILVTDYPLYASMAEWFLMK